MRKKIPENKSLSSAYRLEESEQFLKKLENENEITDDHGPAIIGRRDRQPQSR